MNITRSRRGMTLIETLVTMALASVVFGLILDTLVSTQRESDRLSSTEQMHQEALLISQNVERVLRYRLAPEELEGLTSGGAAPDAAPAGGGAVTTSSLPASIAAISSNTLEVGTSAPRTVARKTPAPTPAVNSQPVQTPEPPADHLAPAQRAEFTSAPASIQNILGTTTSVTAPASASQIQISAAPPGSPNLQQPAAAAQPLAVSQPAPSAIPPSQPTTSTLTQSAAKSSVAMSASPQQPPSSRADLPGRTPAAASSRAASSQERFAADEVVVYSLGSGPDPGKLLTAIRNSRGLGDVPSHAFLEQRPASSAFSPGERRRSLGPNPDKFQSQVSFRFATNFNSTNAIWLRSTQQVPQLVEYTVRVWPVGADDPFDAMQDSIHTPRFQLTSAVSLP